MPPGGETPGLPGHTTIPFHTIPLVSRGTGRRKSEVGRVRAPGDRYPFSRNGASGGFHDLTPGSRRPQVLP